VMIQRPAEDACCVRNLANAQAVIAAPSEKVGCDQQNFLPPTVGVIGDRLKLSRWRGLYE